MTREEAFVSLLEEQGARPPPPGQPRRPKEPTSGLPDSTHLEYTGLKPVTINALWNYERIRTVGELRRYVAEHTRKDLISIPNIRKDGVAQIYIVTGDQS